MWCASRAEHRPHCQLPQGVRTGVLATPQILYLR